MRGQERIVICGAAGRDFPAIKAVMKYKMWTKGVEEGDYREWRAIHAWANQLKSAFLSA